MKKRLAVIWLCGMFLSLTGCKNTEDSSNTVQTEVPVSNETEDSGNSTEENITLKLGFSTKKSDPRVQVSETFKEMVEEQTQGRITVELYADGELGSDAELIKGIINGEVDMTVSSAGNFADYVPKVGASALPFLFSSFEEAWEFVDGETERQIEEELTEYNIKVLAHFDNGFRCVTTSESTGAINSVSDMEGIKIRTPQNQMVMETLSALGAYPYVMDFTKLYEALKNGEFDAQENPVPIIYNSRLYEVQSYLAVTNHSYDMMLFVIRDDIWDSLTEQEQQILQSAASEAQKQDREIIQAQTMQYIDMLKEEGMTITYPDLEEFREATVGVYDYFAASYGEELMELLKKY
ncbi:MAG: TRAP transporter substrate-binding protein [Ruminiclostridium sp.]